MLRLVGQRPEVGLLLLHVPGDSHRRHLLHHHPLQHGQAADQEKERCRRSDHASQGHRPHLLRQVCPLDLCLLYLHQEPGFGHSRPLLPLHRRPRLDRSGLLLLLRLLLAKVQNCHRPQRRRQEVRSPGERQVEARLVGKTGRRRFAGNGAVAGLDKVRIRRFLSSFLPNRQFNEAVSVADGATYPR